MKIHFDKVLFLGAHTDDETACSSMIAKFLENGSQVFIAVFSFCEESVPKEFDKDILRSEFDQAMRILGIFPENVFKYDFKVRHFPTHRQEILEEITILKNKISPDLVLLPTLTDIHQDHNTIAQEGLRAFNRTTSSIFGYHFFYNTTGFNNNGFVEIEQRHLDIKIKALNCYKSQFAKNNQYATEDIVRSMARICGVQACAPLAEVFEIIKLKA